MCARRARGWIALSGVVLSFSSCSVISGFDDLVFDLGDAATGKPVGTPCQQAAECASNSCNDGLCCDRGCGECGRCDFPGSEGTCVFEPVGPDPDGGCVGGVCDGTGSCARGNVVWSKRYGDPADQHLRAVARSPEGGVVLVGQFDGTMDFGGGEVITSGIADVFWARLDRDGNTIAADELTNGDSYADATGVAVDDDGAVLLAVAFASTFEGLDPNFMADQGDSAVLKIVDRTIVWAIPFSGSGVQHIDGIAVDDDGNILVTGWYDYNLIVDGVQQLRPVSVIAANVFVTKLRGDGEHLWSNGYGDDEVAQFGYDIAVSGASGSATVAVTGPFRGSMDPGTGVLVADPTYLSSFAASFDEAGNAAWGSSFGSAGDQNPVSVDIGVDGEVVVAGGMSGTFELDVLHTTTGGMDVFVARYAADGTPLFSGVYGSTGEEEATGMAVDLDGHMVLVGGFDTQVGFGGDMLDTVGGIDVFVAKLSRDGQHLWSQQFGFADNQSAVDVALSQGRIVVGGDFAGIIDFGGSLETQLESEGGTDVFVAVFNP